LSPAQAPMHNPMCVYIPVQPQEQSARNKRPCKPSIQVIGISVSAPTTVGLLPQTGALDLSFWSSALVCQHTSQDIASATSSGQRLILPPLCLHYFVGPIRLLLITCNLVLLLFLYTNRNTNNPPCIAQLAEPAQPPDPRP